MPETVANVIQDVQLIYNDLPSATEPQLGAQTLRLLNKTHVALCEAFPLYTTTSDLTLVAGQREYTISEGYKAIYSAFYLYTSTSQPIALIETSVDELDQENPGWRTTFTGVPFRWYDYGNTTGVPIVGFDPIPQTGTTDGYPTIRLTLGTYTGLLATDSLPQDIRGSSVYVDGLAYQWAKYTGKPDVAMRKAMWTESYEELATYLDRKQRRNLARAKPMLGLGTSAV